MKMDDCKTVDELLECAEFREMITQEMTDARMLMRERAAVLCENFVPQWGLKGEQAALALKLAENIRWLQ